MVLWSFLFKSFIVSTLFGAAICLKMSLPVPFVAQPLSHYSLMFAQIICFAVLYVAFVFGCVLSDPVLANLSIQRTNIQIQASLVCHINIIIYIYRVAQVFNRHD